MEGIYDTLLRVVLRKIRFFHYKMNFPLKSPLGDLGGKTEILQIRFESSHNVGFQNKDD